MGFIGLGDINQSVPTGEYYYFISTWYLHLCNNILEL